MDFKRGFKKDSTGVWCHVKKTYTRGERHRRNKSSSSYVIDTNPRRDTAKRHAHARTAAQRQHSIFRQAETNETMAPHRQV